MKILRRIHRKVHEKSGASLAEMLVVVLLMSIVLTAVSAGAPVLLRVYNNVRIRADAQTLLSTAVNAISEDLYTAREIKSGEGSADHEGNSFYCERRNGIVTYSNAQISGTEDEENTAETQMTIMATLEEPDTGSGEQESAGESDAADQSSRTQALVTAKTQTLGLSVELVPLGSLGRSLASYESESDLISHQPGTALYTFTVRVWKDDVIEQSVEVNVSSMIYDNAENTQE